MVVKRTVVKNLVVKNSVVKSTTPLTQYPNFGSNEFGGHTLGLKERRSHNSMTHPYRFQKNTKCFCHQMLNAALILGLAILMTLKTKKNVNEGKIICIAKSVVTVQYIN